MADRLTKAQAFHRQARSDFAAYEHVRDAAVLPRCHELHFLQMATEKLAKAVLIASHGDPGRTHVAFSKVIGTIKGNAPLARSMGWSGNDLRSFLSRALPMVRAIEELHPQLPTDGVLDGPNAEYPWSGPDRNGHAVFHVPAEHDFSLCERLRSHDGITLLKVIEVLLARFDRFFA